MALEKIKTDDLIPSNVQINSSDMKNVDQKNHPKNCMKSNSEKEQKTKVDEKSMPEGDSLIKELRQHQEI